MKANGRIVLASESPRRRELLGLLGIDFEVIPSRVAEVGYGGDPALLPLRMTRLKVKSVRAELGPTFEGWVLGADTVVAIERESLGKPRDAAAARQMLGKLSGKEHTVYTGYQILASDGESRERTVETKVTMAAMTDGEIEWYVGSGEPFDKAGAYAIQGKGGAFVRSISGSYSNVIGLPLWEVMCDLRELGAISD